MANDTQMFDKDGVVSSMENVGTHFTNVSTAYSAADEQMTSLLTTPDGAMYGDGATKLLAAWDENSGTLEDFMGAFDNWSALVSGMANQFTNLEEGTYEIKQDSPFTKSELADRARAFHTTALKTAAGMAGFNTAQENYRKDHPELFEIDENGVQYRSFKALENGKIVETKIYKDKDGNEYAEVEHWEWDEDQGTFVNHPKYYKDLVYDENVGYFFDTKKKIYYDLKQQN